MLLNNIFVALAICFIRFQTRIHIQSFDWRQLCLLSDFSQLWLKVYFPYNNFYDRCCGAEIFLSKIGFSIHFFFSKRPVSANSYIIIDSRNTIYKVTALGRFFVSLEFRYIWYILDFEKKMMYYYFDLTYSLTDSSNS